MKNTILFLRKNLLVLLLLGSSFSILADELTPVESARSTIERLIGNRINDVVLQEISIESAIDTFTYQASGGTVTVSGNTGVAICRGFYSYFKKNHLGQVSWTGNRVEIPAQFPDEPLTTGKSPYKNRYYFNVVTYGYSMPYWDWSRWQQEIDWMAFHGINMPLMLVGVEAIGTKVWKELGLTQAEIDSHYTGPAHLPWQRMGNINNVDGPLPESWHTDQVSMAHKILDQMHSLGMNPIVQGFSGFVPKGFKRIHPEDKLHETNWGGFPAQNHAFMLTPSSPRFKTIQKKYIAEWEKEFGKCNYYLIDSFNEMELPNTGQPDSVLLADYGEQIYESLSSSNPEATWVIQGWMFGYQRNIWSPANVRGLLKKVPDDKMFILDEACDYNANFWNNGSNWERFNAFGNKEWGWGVIPNMGGKTAYTGIMSFYASEPARALNSTKKGRLTGFGLCPEGIENNDALYELLNDVAWTNKAVDLNDWIQDYCKTRYGACPAEMTDAWTYLQKSAYGTFTDHPRFGWQTMTPGGGTTNNSMTYHMAVKKFLECSEELNCNTLYQADAIEMTAISLGLKADEYYAEADLARRTGKTILRDSAMARTLRVLTEMDKLLESHPLHKLERWLDYARDKGIDDAQKQKYESNARKLVTTWGSSTIRDYSARMWSGLIRDFYRERLSAYFASVKKNSSFNANAWEAKWVTETGISTIAAFEDPCRAAKLLFDKYIEIPDMGIAFNKPVTASSSQAGYSSATVTDGSSTGIFWSADPYPQFVTIDLLNNARIDSMRIFTYVDGIRYYQYSVYRSADNKNWDRVVDFSKNTTRSNAKGDFFTFSPTFDTRYLKVLMTKNSENPGVHLHEVRVFGKMLSDLSKVDLISSIPTYNIYSHGKNIVVDIEENKADLTVFDIEGKKIMNAIVHKGKNKIRADVKQGVYLIQLNFNPITISKQVIIG